MKFFESLKYFFVICTCVICVIFAASEPIEGSFLDNGLLCFLLKICSLVLFALCAGWLYEHHNNK